MKDLEKIIDSLTKDEIRFYKLFINRTSSGKNKSRKDEELFNFLKKGKHKDHSTKEILKKLSISNSNNYYQLKNRIYNDINNSMTWQHISKDKQSSSFSYILLARVFKNRAELEISFNYLLKAEKIAIKEELYELLSIIYTEIIELSHELISIDIENYIKLKEYNINMLREIDQIDILLARIMYDIKTKQNFSKSEASLTNIINKKFTETRQNEILLNSPRFKLRLFKMYSRILLQNGEFPALQDFLLASLEQFNKEKFFSRNNHEEKLTLLTYLVNCYYKNKEYKLSLKYAEKLKEAMSEYDAFLEDKYMFYYYNALVLNYGETDIQKSLKVLKEASQNEVIKSIPAYSSFIYLNTSIIYFQTKQFKLAQKNISRLILQHDFVNLDNVFQFQVFLLQIILKVELKDFISAKEKIKTLLSCYKKLLKDKIYSVDKDLISIINDIIDNKSVEEKIRAFIKTYSDTINPSRTTVIDYFSWVKKFLK